MPQKIGDRLRTLEVPERHSDKKNEFVRCIEYMDLRAGLNSMAQQLENIAVDWLTEITIAEDMLKAENRLHVLKENLQNENYS